MEERKIKYYEVECKCGHTGSRRFYIPIKFPVKAYSKTEAAKKGKLIPRCKRDHKDCILNVKEISFVEYIDLQKLNNIDPYLKCHSIQEQNQYDLSDRFVEDPHYYETHQIKMRKSDSIHPIYQGKIKIKNPKKFIRFNKEYSMEVYC